jgi:hypothetical protein
LVLCGPSGLLAQAVKADANGSSGLLAQMVERRADNMIATRR